MRGGVWLSAVLLGALHASGAAAQNDSAAARDYARTGFYVGATAAAGLPNFDNTFMGGPVSSDPAPMASVRGGWRFAARGALEFMNEWGAFGTGSAQFSSIASTFNVKWIVPLGRTEPFVLFGMGAHIAVPEGSGDAAASFAWRGGLGVQFHITENLSALAEGSYLGTTEATSDVPYGSAGLGLQLRF